MAAAVTQNNKPALTLLALVRHAISLAGVQEKKIENTA